MESITEDYHVLIPAYGRRLTSGKDALANFEAGLDWRGDVSMGFAYCSIRDFKEGVKVNLRYGKDYRRLIVVTVHHAGPSALEGFGAAASEGGAA